MLAIALNNKTKAPFVNQTPKKVCFFPVKKIHLKLRLTLGWAFPVSCAAQLQLELTFFGSQL